ncbi:pre-peptidase C-terminal domain-containing protein [Aggregatilinea lenta]|uniref:pre-peptidase C-terminal domain-containing protein n=1 Tax=Aggregatilinea lenta TaxID=913108 RepID=UPI000E5A1E2E|nr:pre-peptidase C-terminal domain-containing protein [Aggregatilinea lenta]
MRNRRDTTWWAGLVASVALALGACAAAPRVLGAPPAQTGTPIAYGDTVAGEITEDVPCVYYWFDGHAGDTITLDMQRTSGSLDGQIWLYLEDADPNTAPIAFNDDRPSGGLNPLVETTLPAADWYTVGACRLQHANMRVTVGTFTLTLTGPESSGAADESSAPEPTADSAVTGAATPTGEGGLTGDLFPVGTATAAPTGLPPSTVEPAATEPVESEDGWVYPFGYTPLPDAAAQALPEDAVTSLDYDQPTAGYLWADQPERLHELAVDAGDVVVIEWQQPTDALQPRITVTTPDGTVIARVDLPDVVHGARLTFVAPDVPSVLIHVARFDGATDASTGGYTLLARRSVSNTG